MLESAELAAGTQVDQYSVVRLLGRGGMGEVYLARDASLGRRVALKLIARDCLADTQLRERFLYEARTTARFSHPNIVNIHSIGEYDGRPYMALEYLEGESLRDRLARGALPQREALAIGACIADALAEAHRHGILHRDLKPANVMLAADGRPRVLDFGLAMGLPDGAAGEASARAMSVTKPPPFEHTSTGLRGTPHFMAPEQWAEAEASAATDVWALGVCLVQMFSGELPYGDVGSLLSLAARVSSAAEVPRVAALGARLPAPAGRLLARCLDKRAEGRPQAAEVASGLRAALGTSTPSVAITHPAAPARPPAAESAIGEMPTLAQPAVAQARAEQAQQTPAAPRRRSSLALWIVLAFVAVAAAGVGVGLAVRGSGAKRDAEPALAQKPPAASPKDAKNPSAADAAPSALALAAKQIQVQTAPSRVEQRQGPAPSPSPDSDQPPQRQARTTPEPAARPPAPRPRSRPRARPRPRPRPRAKTPQPAMPSLDMSSLRSADIKRRCATVFEGVPRPSRHRGAGSCGVLSVAVYCGCKRNRLSYARSAWRAVQALRSSSCRPQWAQRSCRERGYWLGKQPTFKDVLWFFNSKKCSWVARATPLLLRRPDVTIHYKNRARAFWGICICRDKRPDARRRALAMLGHITIKADAARLKYHCQRAGISLAP